MRLLRLVTQESLLRAKSALSRAKLAILITLLLQHILKLLLFLVRLPTKELLQSLFVLLILAFGHLRFIILHQHDHDDDKKNESGGVAHDQAGVVPWARH